MDNEAAVLRIRQIIEAEKLSPAGFAKKIGFNQSNLSKVLSGNRKVPAKLLDSILEETDVNRTWLLTGEGGMWNEKREDVHKHISTASPTEKLLPRIPYTVQAGALTDAISGVRECDCEMIPVIRALPKYDYTIIVKGDSMEPKYEGGDEIACKRIDKTSFIQWGKPHVLDTAQGLVLKRIYDDGDRIRCVSYNEEYPDFSVAKDEIYSISLVVGLIRI